MKVLGLMSGTSLDGLDLAVVEFRGFPNRTEAIKWEILAGKTVEYSAEWQYKLNNSINLSGFELMQLHSDYGSFLAEACNNFTAENNLKPELIASHGHTVFHEPKKGFTTQIGNGNVIAAKTGINTVYDFRTLDVAFGGQGAPLVPIGDQYLFAQYDACLNLGGIANISFKKDGRRIAFDICPFNLLLNHFSKNLGSDFDDSGQLAKSGEVNDTLLKTLGSIKYYLKAHPKSLDKEALLAEYIQIINSIESDSQNVLATLVEHFAFEISKQIKAKNCLVTGGGTFNSYFISKLQSKSKTEIIRPNEILINFKEALIFALMGYLRLYELDNVLSSATGSEKNSCSGSLILA